MTNKAVVEKWEKEFDKFIDNDDNFIGCEDCYDVDKGLSVSKTESFIRQLLTHQRQEAVMETIKKIEKFLYNYSSITQDMLDYKDWNKLKSKLLKNLSSKK